MRFQPVPDGGTRVELQFCYEPLNTGIDDAIHAIVSPPREAQVRSDLARARFFFASLPRTTHTDVLPGIDERRSA